MHETQTTTMKVSFASRDAVLLIQDLVRDGKCEETMNSSVYAYQTREMKEEAYVYYQGIQDEEEALDSDGKGDTTSTKNNVEHAK